MQCQHTDTRTDVRKNTHIHADTPNRVRGEPCFQIITSFFFKQKHHFQGGQDIECKTPDPMESAHTLLLHFESDVSHLAKAVANWFLHAVCSRALRFHYQSMASGMQTTQTLASCLGGHGQSHDLAPNLEGHVEAHMYVEEKQNQWQNEGGATLEKSSHFPEVLRENEANLD